MLGSRDVCWDNKSSRCGSVSRSFILHLGGRSGVHLCRWRDSSAANALHIQTLHNLFTQRVSFKALIKVLLIILKVLNCYYIRCIYTTIIWKINLIKLWNKLSTYLGMFKKYWTTPVHMCNAHLELMLETHHS